MEQVNEQVINNEQVNEQVNEKISICGVLYTLAEIKADKILLQKYRKKLYQKQYINTYMKEYNKKQKEKDYEAYRAKKNEYSRKLYATNDEYRKNRLEQVKVCQRKKRGVTKAEVKKYRKFYLSDDGDLIEIFE